MKPYKPKILNLNLNISGTNVSAFMQRLHKTFIFRSVFSTRRLSPLQAQDAVAKFTIILRTESQNPDRFIITPEQTFYPT